MTKPLLIGLTGYAGTVENLAMAVDSALNYCFKVRPSMLQFVALTTETQP
jgi:hypothetical protein